MTSGKKNKIMKKKPTWHLQHHPCHRSETKATDKLSAVDHTTMIPISITPKASLSQYAL